MKTTFSKKELVPGLFILASIVFLILKMLYPASFYGLISNGLLIIAMVLVIVGNKKKKKG